jgi:hypothetical protein
MLIQAKVKDRRDRMQQVTAMALEHFKVAIEAAHKSGSGAGVLRPLFSLPIILGFWT